jgi:phage terminase large subunit GpA-like protein
VLRISGACIDSGGHYTQQVYGFCKGKTARRIFATKGMAGQGRPIVSSAMHRRSGRNRRAVELFTIGVDEAKGLLYSRLKITVPGPGFCHFPIADDFDAEWFAQLAAEKAVTRYHRGFPRREWVKIRPRNEALDCWIEAMAALYLVNPSWQALERRSAPRAQPDQAKEENLAQPLFHRRMGLGRPKRHGWVGSWRRG